MKRKIIMTLLSLMLIVGLIMVAGSVGNLEYADLTRTQGFTEGQFWSRVAIGIALAAVAVFGANRLERSK